MIRALRWSLPSLAISSIAALAGACSHVTAPDAAPDTGPDTASPPPSQWASCYDANASRSWRSDSVIQSPWTDSVTRYAVILPDPEPVSLSVLMAVPPAQADSITLYSYTFTRTATGCVVDSAFVLHGPRRA